MFSDQNGIKLEINDQKSNVCLNNTWIQKFKVYFKKYFKLMKMKI